jgi:hypothetical protein
MTATYPGLTVADLAEYWVPVDESLAACDVLCQAFQVPWIGFLTDDVCIQALATISRHQELTDEQETITYAFRVMAGLAAGRERGHIRAAVDDLAEWRAQLQCIAWDAVRSRVREYLADVWDDAANALGVEIDDLPPTMDWTGFDPIQGDGWRATLTGKDPASATLLFSVEVVE